MPETSKVAPARSKVAVKICVMSIDLTAIKVCHNQL